jgi:hypothetical protein
MRSRFTTSDVYQMVRRAPKPRIGYLARLAPIVLVVALLAATAAAFAFAQRAKLADSPIQNIRFDRRLVSPVGGAREVPVRFRLLNEDHVTVDIVDANGAIVRDQLLSGRYEPKSVLFSWDARDGQGRAVPDGLYRLRISLADEGRTLEVPDEIRVDGTPPTIEKVEIKPRVISPDGDRRSDRASVSYRFSEPAYAVLYVDGKRSRGRSFRKRPVGVLQWYGRGVRLGTYRLALAAQDPAGNMSPSTRAFEVRVRYVELARRLYRVRPGARINVRVSTDSTTLSYTLGPLRRKVGADRPIRRFNVTVPRRPGRYLLTVRVGNHSARATVVVVPERR